MNQDNTEQDNTGHNKTPHRDDLQLTDKQLLDLITGPLPVQDEYTRRVLRDACTALVNRLATIKQGVLIVTEIPASSGLYNLKLQIYHPNTDTTYHYRTYLTDETYYPHKSPVTFAIYNGRIIWARLENNTLL